MENNNPPVKQAIHPVMVIAAVAVVLFCGVGSAAIMGWLPSSAAVGHTDATTSVQAGQPVQNGAQTAYAGTNNQPAQTQQLAPARDTQLAANACSNCGVIESIREIQQRGQGSGAGAAGGAVLGGLLGNQVGSGHGRQLATVAGAIGGAVAGNQIEGNMKTTHSWEIVVRLDNGKTRTLHQSSQPAWRSGDSVKIVNGHLQTVG